MPTSSHRGLTRDELEARRLKAAEDLQNHLRQSKVAKKYGVTRTTASRWARALKAGGTGALGKRKAPGRTPRLNAEQLAIVAGLCERRLTALKLAKVIELMFGVHYHPDHVYRLKGKLMMTKQNKSGRKAKAKARGIKVDRHGLVKCRVCSCTEIKPCDPPCSWASVDLCSGCAEAIEALIRWTEGAHRSSLRALIEAFKAELRSRIKNLEAELKRRGAGR